MRQKLTAPSAVLWTSPKVALGLLRKSISIVGTGLIVATGVTGGAATAL
jgi:hypothetical protein